ncbi:hypothetical protein [Flavivirga rizhaonensis]|uniref:DUF4249 family protein n=1 Tax=Flavivirga rizhaonensis TaxID=2559571 RepID=A0A4S1DTA2_9FLAO|nr:hypothetical protein [Flavivirga rizhaonensis]TGV01005.1 hypothetical protein EM932_17200 [Flavivirga rizhaonensis]
MKQYLPIILLMFLFSFSSCDDALDCIINVRPELRTKTLALGFVDEYYSEMITAEIKNEVNDNDYNYYFDVVGRLPEGLEVFYNRRREVVFKGISKEAGRFRLEVYLEVTPHYDEYGRINGPLCSDNTSESYVLVIR